jgi:LPS export ABC transporter protein LptC
MTSWQRWLRLVLGVFVVVFAVGVYVAMRRQPSPPPRRPVATLDSKAVMGASRGTFRVLKGGTVDCIIDYDSVLEYAADATKIGGVKATFPRRTGRDLEVRGDKASVTQDQSTFSITGNVRFTTSDGLVLTTAEASYAKAEGIVRAPGKVEFTRAAMRGSGVGMTYDQQRDILSLLDSFEMTTTETEGQPPSEVHSGTAVWARADKTMRFERDAKIVRRGETLEADTATTQLTPDEQHVQMIQLQGNSRITGAPPPVATAGDNAGSTLRGMRARDITLNYSPDGQTLQQATLGGGSTVEVASNLTRAVTRISGEFIDFGLEPDGTTMRSLAARGASPAARAELELPAQADAPPRVVRALAIQGPTPGAASQPGRGLTSLRFTDNVEYREMPAPPAAPRIATARTLDLALQPGFGAIDEARFSGNATLKEGTSLGGVARDARYVVKRGTFEFTGNDDRGRPPQVKDQQQATIDGTRIVVAPDTRKVSASGEVHTTFQAAQPGANAPSVHTPGILDQNQPVYAISDELDYDGAASHATFRSKGQSRLWQPSTGTQGGTTIAATEIVLDDKTGDLSARGAVVSTMMLDQTDDKTKRVERVSTKVEADELMYADAKHRATYTGHVRMTGGVQGTLTTDKAVLNLTEDSRALDTLDGYENVEVHDEGTPSTGPRTATGDRLTYTAADERYKVTGKLVKIDEKCFGESQGRTLTFWRSVDRMIIDGNTERRTQTKGGQGCSKK